MATGFDGDRIILKDLGFYGHHGVMAEERVLGQRFFIDLECGLDLSEPARSDRVEGTVSYADVYDVVKAAFEAETLNLIEAVGQRIADAVFAAFPAVDWIVVRVRKPEAPIAMVRGEAAVELHRRRGGRAHA